MIRIFLVDDHQIVRDGIKKLLESDDELKVIGEATDTDEALEMLSKLKIDILITDISLANSSGFDLTKKTRQLFPELPILVLSMHNSADYINEALNVGANGYLLKDCTKQEMFSAIVTVMKKEIYLSKTASQILMNRALNEKNTPAKNIEANEGTITRRELEVIKMISDGLTNKEIANKLNLSVRTVDKHRFNILQKFNASNTAEMLKKAKSLLD